MCCNVCSLLPRSKPTMASSLNHNEFSRLNGSILLFSCHWQGSFAKLVNYLNVLVEILFVCLFVFLSLPYHFIACLWWVRVEADPSWETWEISERLQQRCSSIKKKKLSDIYSAFRDKQVLNTISLLGEHLQQSSSTAAWQTHRNTWCSIVKRASKLQT